MTDPTDLLILKNAVIDTLNELAEDTREEIKLAIYNLFSTPLVGFNEGYDFFVGSIGQNASASDRWRIIQMDLVTKIGPGWRQTIEEFASTYMSIMQQSPGGETFFTNKDVWDTLSYRIAAAIRVYGDTLHIVGEQKEISK